MLEFVGGSRFPSRSMTVGNEQHPHRDHARDFLNVSNPLSRMSRMSMIISLNRFSSPSPTSTALWGCWANERAHLLTCSNRESIEEIPSTFGNHPAHGAQFKCPTSGYLEGPS